MFTQKKKIRIDQNTQDFFSAGGFPVPQDSENINIYLCPAQGLVVAIAIDKLGTTG